MTVDLLSDYVRWKGMLFNYMKRLLALLNILNAFDFPGAHYDQMKEYPVESDASNQISNLLS